MSIVEQIRKSKPQTVETISQDMAAQLSAGVTAIISERLQAESRAEITAALAEAKAKVMIMESEKASLMEKHQAMQLTINDLMNQINGLKQELTQTKAVVVSMEEDEAEDEKENQAKQMAYESKIRQLEKENSLLKGKLSVPVPEIPQVPEFEFDIERDRSGRITNVTARPIGVN